MKIIIGDKQGYKINGSMKFLKYVEPGPDYTEPFYVENMSESEMVLEINNSRYYTSYPNVYKSYDKVNWENVGTPSCNISIPVGGKVYLRSKVSCWGPSRSNGGPAYIRSSSEYRIGGNIMSLLQGEDFSGEIGTLTSTNSRTFQGFINNGANTYDGLIDASLLLLPGNTCEYCYYDMFGYSTNLTKAPLLPAETLTNNCYQYMFSRCSSLSEVKCLASDMSAADCLKGWMNVVPATGTFYKKAGVTWPSGGSGIPNGWTVVEV